MQKPFHTKSEMNTPQAEEKVMRYFTSYLKKVIWLRNSCYL